MAKAALDPLEKMEQAITGIKSFSQFQKNSKCVRLYFEACQSLCGKKNLPWDEYLTLLDTLEKANKLNPLVANRLWAQHHEVTALNFQLQLEKSYSREIHMPAWLKFYDSWIEALTKESDPLKIKFDDRELAILEIINKIQSEIQFVNNFLSKASGNKVFAEVAKSKSLQQAAAALVLNLISHGRFAEGFKIADADAILAQIASIRRKPVIALSGTQLTSALKVLKPFILARIPDPTRLVLDEKIFSKKMTLTRKSGELIPWNEMKSGIYSFNVIPRKIHALVIQLATGDCSFQHGLLPRWATYLTKDSFSYLVHRERKFYGSIFIAPVVDLERNLWASVESFSSLMNYICTEQNNDHLAPELCFTKALRQIKSRLPDAFKGVLVAPTFETDNYSTLSIFSQTDSFTKGFPPKGPLRLQDDEVQDFIAKNGHWPQDTLSHFEQIPMVSTLAMSVPVRSPVL